MRLLATAHNPNHYEISREGLAVATLALRPGPVGRITLASGPTLLLRRDSPLRDNYTIAAEDAAPPGDPLLRATRANSLRRAYAISASGQRLILRAESPWRGDYLVIQDDALAGAIRQAPRGRDATADLPDTIAPDAAIAVFCFILARWRQGNARVDTI
jgi:hypothetical protein